MKYSKSEVEESLARLREWLKPGDTVYTILRHRSASGMSREIGVTLLSNDERRGIVDLHPNYAVARVLGARMGKRDGIVLGGCGMDMGFHLVHSLSSALFPKGYGCIGKGCPSNDHANGDKDYKLHAAGMPRYADGAAWSDKPLSWEKSGRVHWHRDGGYALRHRWL
jgi:hypothetical protein